MVDKTRSQLEMAAAVNRASRQESLKEIQDKSNDRLLGIISKKIQTCFIGNIARFEEFFGRIWGHGKKREDCTPNELKWREVWNNCRNQILNFGNSHIRAIQNEIPQYEMTWKGFNYTFKGENK